LSFNVIPKMRSSSSSCVRPGWWSWLWLWLCCWWW